MATVRERFISLGLSHSNKILIKAGCVVADAYQKDRGYFNQHTKLQDEDGIFYSVNDYPDSWEEKMDAVIISWINTQK